MQGGCIGLRPSSGGACLQGALLVWGSLKPADALCNTRHSGRNSTVSTDAYTQYVNHLWRLWRVAISALPGQTEMLADSNIRSLIQSRLLLPLSPSNVSGESFCTVLEDKTGMIKLSAYLITASVTASSVERHHAVLNEFSQYGTRWGSSRL